MWDKKKLASMMVIGMAAMCMLGGCQKKKAQPESAQTETAQSETQAAQTDRPGRGAFSTYAYKPKIFRSHRKMQ